MNPYAVVAPEAGVSVIPSPFIKIYERGRDNTHTSLLRLMLVNTRVLVLERKDFPSYRRWRSSQ